MSKQEFQLRRSVSQEDLSLKIEESVANFAQALQGRGVKTLMINSYYIDTRKGEGMREKQKFFFAKLFEEFAAKGMQIGFFTPYYRKEEGGGLSILNKQLCEILSLGAENFAGSYPCFNCAVFEQEAERKSAALSKIKVLNEESAKKDFGKIFIYDDFVQDIEENRGERRFMLCEENSNTIEEFMSTKQVPYRLNVIDTGFCEYISTSFSKVIDAQPSAAGRAPSSAFNLQGQPQNVSQQASSFKCC